MEDEYDEEKESENEELYSEEQKGRESAGTPIEQSDDENPQKQNNNSGLSDKIKTVRQDYNKQRTNMKKIETERHGKWDMSVKDIEKLVTNI